jgi:NAD(P)-dependent dehydrogenase (short-subunit alcohol dehydrogenase family)
MELVTENSDKDSSRPVALITGASGKLGGPIANLLGSIGYRLTLHGFKSTDRLTSLRTDLTGRGFVSNIFTGDLSKNNAGSELVRSAFASYARLDLMVLSASAYVRGGLRKLPTEPILRKMFAVNIFNAMEMMGDFSFLSPHGSVVIMLDARIADSRTKDPLYVLTKKMLADLVRMAAVELAPGIRVNGIAPGILIRDPHDSSEAIEHNRSLTVSPSPDPLADFLETLRYVISNQSLTGEIIFSDGGRHL